MEKIYNKIIIIGRDSTDNSLDVALVSGDVVKPAKMGGAGSVPSCVSRYRNSERKGHCYIEISDSGRMILHNDNPSNHTYVNGQEIQSKKIDAESKIELGSQRYALNLKSVLETAKKLAVMVNGGGAPEKKGPKEFSVSHLRDVWDGYHGSLRELKEKQKKVQLIRSACGILTVCVAPSIAFFGPGGYVLTGLALLGNFYTFFGMKNDNTSDQQEKLLDDFQDTYICPNDECGRFLGSMSYKLLRKNYTNCPYCKSKFID